MLRLLTIPISHYCEKARWALDRVGAPYVEEAHLQLFHYLPVRRAGGRATVPVLVHPEGVLTDSTDILRWIDERTSPAARLFPPEGSPEHGEVAALEADFDEHVGPAGRLWMYQHLLDRPELAHRFGTTGVPRWQKSLLPLGFPFVARFLRWRLRTSADAADEALRICRATLDTVAERLADGRRFLAGDRFTAADLTFASLCAPLLMTPGYGVPLPQPTDLPPIVAREIDAHRAHPAGQFVMRVYAEQRREVIADAWRG